MIARIRSAIFAWNRRRSERRAREAARARQSAREAYQAARSKGDTRAMCEALKALVTATHDELRAAR